MDKLSMAIAIIAGLGVVGIFVLVGMEKEVVVVVPIVTTLVGWLVGKEQVVERVAKKMAGKK